MSVTIAIPPIVEQQLRDDAARQGVSLEEIMLDFGLQNKPT
jgi:hypothetical protein